MGELVVKTNPIVGAHYSLTAMESNLLLYLFRSIEKDAKEIRDVEVTTMDIIEALWLPKNGTTYEKIAQVSKQLMSRVIQIHNKETRVLTQFQWLSMAKYEYKKGVVKFRFNEMLVPYLLDFSEYTKLNMWTLLKIKGVHAKRIYELLVQNSGMAKKWKRARGFVIAELKAILGMEKNEYPLFSDFQRRVILPAITEINEKTNILVDFELEKTSRKYTDIMFFVTEKKNKKTEEQGKLEAMGIDTKTAQRLANTHTPEEVAAWITALKNASNVKNPAGWLVDYLASGYASEQAERIRLADESKENAKKLKALKEQVSALNNDYRAYKDGVLDLFYSTLWDTGREVFNVNFSQYMAEKYPSKYEVLIKTMKPFYEGEYIKNAWLFPILDLEGFAKNRGLNLSDINAQIVALGG